jgi:hypothetical protein
VFAVVSEEDFYDCLTNGKEEGLDLGQVLAILVHLYATRDLQLADYKDEVANLRDA